MDKKVLRKILLKKRDALEVTDIHDLSSQITKQLLKHPKFISAKTVFLYSSFGSEVSTKEMIKETIKAKKEVYLPVLKRETICVEGVDASGKTMDMTSPPELIFYKFASFEEMKIGKFGIMEPTSNIHCPKDPDLIIVPGVAFDLHGHRLGYGKGYYDQFLKTTSGYKIGIAFDLQIVEKIPNDLHDQKMDEVISEKRKLKILKV